MNKAPLISVIVPVYNTAPWLRRCLDSICGQSYPHLEIICVNDGSTDDSAAILAEYAVRDSRIIVINQPNSGLSAARNAGLDVATGEYVTGLDSDDYLELNAYEWVIDRMGERRVDIVCFGFMMEEEGKPWQKTEALNMPEGYYCRADIAVERMDNCNFCNKLWKRDFLSSLGVKFPVGLLFEDLAFWNMAAPYAKDFLFYPQCLYHYVQRGSSIMHTADYKAHCMNKIKVFNAICQFWKEKGGGETNLLPVLAKEYDNILDITPFWAKNACSNHSATYALNGNWIKTPIPWRIW